MKTLAVLYAVNSLNACRSASTEPIGNDPKFVMSDDNPTRAIVGFSLFKSTKKNPKQSISDLKNDAVVSSCGYQIQLNKSDDTIVKPLNRYAFDSRWGAVRGNAKYYGGAVVAFTGMAAGVILIGGSSAAGLLVPPAFYGIGPGLFLTTSSGLVGSAIGASGNNDINANELAAATFKEIIAREKITTEYFYEDRLERIRKSGNTLKECPHMSVGDLKVIGGLRAGKAS